jgi:hypothetical protein
MSEHKFNVGDRVRVNNPDFKTRKQLGTIIGHIDTLNVVRLDKGSTLKYHSNNLELANPEAQFQVGDLVKVLYRSDFPKGSGVTWVSDMDKAIGKYMRVKFTYTNGDIQLEDGFVYPATSLQKANPPPHKPIADFTIGQYVEVVTYGSVYQGKSGKIVDRETSPERWGVYFVAEDVTRYFYASELRNVKPPEFQVGDSVEIIDPTSKFFAYWGTVTEQFGTNLRVSIPRDDGPPYSLLYNPEELKLISSTATPVINQENEMSYPQGASEPKLMVSSVDPKKPVQQVTYVFGIDAANVSDSAIFEHIRRLEGEIANLDAIKNKPAKLKAEIASKKAQIDELVSFVDERA